MVFLKGRCSNAFRIVRKPSGSLYGQSVCFSLRPLCLLHGREPYNVASQLADVQHHDDLCTEQVISFLHACAQLRDRLFYIYSHYLRDHSHYQEKERKC